MIIFNNISNVQKGIKLYDYPVITASNENINFHSVVGRLGSLVEHTRVHENIKISCTFSIVDANFSQKLREIRKWLKGPGKLSIDEDHETFYDAQHIEYGDIERELKLYGRFTVVFHCTPYEYIQSGQEFITPEVILNNPYDECYPLYKIVGEGKCTLTVNDYKFEVNVGQDITIDTALMITYRTDEILNTSAKGDYDKLKLLPGDNTIFISNGFELLVAPRWGYIT